MCAVDHGANHCATLSALCTQQVNFVFFTRAAPKLHFLEHTDIFCAISSAGPYSHEQQQQPSTRPWGPGSYHQHYQNNPDETGSTSASETSQRRLSSQSAHTDEGQETASSKGHLLSSSSSSAVTSRDYQGTGANGNYYSIRSFFCKSACQPPFSFRPSFLPSLPPSLLPFMAD